MSGIFNVGLESESSSTTIDLVDVFLNSGLEDQCEELDSLLSAVKTAEDAISNIDRAENLIKVANENETPVTDATSDFMYESLHASLESLGCSSKEIDEVLNAEIGMEGVVSTAIKAGKAVSNAMAKIADTANTLAQKVTGLFANLDAIYVSIKKEAEDMIAEGGYVSEGLTDKQQKTIAKRFLFIAKENGKKLNLDILSQAKGVVTPNDTILTISNVGEITIEGLNALAKAKTSGDAADALVGNFTNITKLIKGLKDQSISSYGSMTRVLTYKEEPISKILGKSLLNSTSVKPSKKVITSLTVKREILALKAKDVNVGTPTLKEIVGSKVLADAAAAFKHDNDEYRRMSKVYSYKVTGNLINSLNASIASARSAGESWASLSYAGRMGILNRSIVSVIQSTPSTVLSDRYRTTKAILGYMKKSLSTYKKTK